MWQMTEHGAEGEPRVIRSMGCDPAQLEDGVHFFLCDDDGNIMWDGVTTDVEEPGEVAFAPLDWAQADSGCTEMWVRNEIGQWELL